MTVVLDSCVFISALDPKDVFHSECLPLVRRLVTEDLEAMCPVLVLTETVCALGRRIGNRRRAESICVDLLEMPSIAWSDVSRAAAVRAAFLGLQTGLRGADAVMLQAAESSGIPLVTKDAEIRTRAPEGVLVFEPDELP